MKNECIHPSKFRSLSAGMTLALSRTTSWGVLHTRVMYYHPS